MLILHSKQHKMLNQCITGTHGMFLVMAAAFKVPKLACAVCPIYEKMKLNTCRWKNVYLKAWQSCIHLEYPCQAQDPGCKSTALIETLDFS